MSTTPTTSLFIPLFYEDEILCWAGAIIHEGENGANEPGGLSPERDSRRTTRA